MISFFEIAAFLMTALLLYVYLGYPAILLLLRGILPEHKVHKKEIYPRVSLLISCFNEEAVIREKLENSLAIDYPEGKLEIIVVSDASTDRTDEITGEYAARGVRLVRQDRNLGKTSALNIAVEQTTGEILVFSDANAMYQPDAILRLVRNFYDEKVGYAVGEAKYRDATNTAATRSESTYWRLEILLKKMESYIHSVVGGDGAIYAIRRELYEKLLETDINDFVNPLQIILKGYRGIYEKEAVCWEDSAGSFQKEFRRKIRIINRSLSGLLRMKAVLNPFKTGIFSFEIVSHKLLRWFVPLFLICLIISCFALSLLGVKIFHWISLSIILFMWFAYAGYLFADFSISPVFYYPYYFVMVNMASLIGVGRSFKGEIQTTWETVRANDGDRTGNYSVSRSMIHVFFFISLPGFLQITGRLAGVSLLPEKITYWSAVAIILYVYMGYPLILKLLSGYFHKPVHKREIEPEVTLLICAYNEEEVIEEKVKNCLQLDYPRRKLKIVIASDGSTDRTNDIVRGYVDERLILMDYPERRGKMTVINDTVPKLESEIIVFSDANTMYREDAIKKLARNFNDPSVGAVSADVVLHNEATFGKSESLYYRYERWIQQKESEFGSIIGADGGMYAIRRRLFVQPSSNIILDDFVISMNVVLGGQRLVYDREALGYEKSSDSPKTEFLRKSRVIAGAIQSIMQKEGVPTVRQKGVFFCYASHKFLRWMIPLILIILFIVNLRLYYLTGEFIYAVTIKAQTIFYLLAAADMFIAKIIRLRITSLPFYFCLVNGAALYGIYKGLFSKQPVKWQKFSRETEAF
ncbi:MAG: glycosyltransferase family 2 protein [Nitrospirae bacterium]|nr:glycosyltransferase family 2 protein [Nitrospirota bacterium]